jgi:GTP cyclohydrolase I
VSPAYVSKLERGQVTHPRPATVAALAGAYDVPPSEVATWVGYSLGDGDGRARPGVDRERIEKAVREILEAIGDDPDRDGLRRTPERVAAMFEEIFAGLGDHPDQHLSVTFSAEHDEMVMVKDIPLYSVCEHHLVPFLGRAHVAYIPNVEGRITGLSKLARLVDSYSRRPQVQERLTTQIADEIVRSLQPRGVLVVVEAEHLCMTMRGVRTPGTLAVTSAVRGQFHADPATRAEAMDFIRGRR